MPDHPSASMAAPGAAPGQRRGRMRQAAVVATVLAAAFAGDQASKRWAWENVPARINRGATSFLGPEVSRWYADPWSGRVLDALSASLLAAALVVLLRRRRSRLVLSSAALLLGGCASNLLDRLGMDAVTIPGSGRGVVDFILVSGTWYNVADLVIMVGALLGGAAVRRFRQGARARGGPPRR